MPRGWRAGAAQRGLERVSPFPQRVPSCWGRGCGGGRWVAGVPACTWGGEGKRWRGGGSSSPAFPPWLSPAVPWPGAQPPCAEPPGPPPATRPSPRGGWCRTRPNPGKRKGVGSAHVVIPQNGEPSPTPDPAAVSSRRTLSLGLVPITVASGHAGEKPSPKVASSPSRGKSCPVASRRGYGRPRAGAAVPTAPAGNVIPIRRLLPSRCCRAGKARRDPPPCTVPACRPPGCPPLEGRPAGRALCPPPHSEGVPWHWERVLWGDSGSPQDKAGAGVGSETPPAHPPAPGAGGSGDTHGIPQPQGSGCHGGW